MNEIVNFTSFQKSEVSKLEWKTRKETLTAIRNYSTKRKQIINNIKQICNI